MPQERGAIAADGDVPHRSAVIARARELLRFARQQGYRCDEVIEMIEALP